LGLLGLDWQRQGIGFLLWLCGKRRLLHGWIKRRRPGVDADIHGSGQRPRHRQLLALLLKGCSLTIEG
jgi:hypothetical protein